MRGEDAALAVIAAMPFVAGFAAWRCVRGARAAPAGRRATRLVVGNALVAAFLASVAMFGAECWLRFFYDSTDSYGLMRTTDRWLERHYRFNGQNVRDDVEYDLGPIPPGVRRVTFVGDSFAAGHGVADVNDRFANRVRAARPDWQVHVFAANGVDTGSELHLVEKNLPGYQYDVVVLVYCLNDISDLMQEYDAVRRRMTELRDDRGLLARNSYACDALRFLWIATTDREFGDYYPSIVSAYSSALWDEHAARLRRFHEVVAARGGRMAVVTFPFLNDLGPGYGLRDAHRRLADFWAAQGVPALDLLPTYEGRAARDLVVGRFDAHPNEKAHELATAAILPFLDGVVAGR